ERRRLVIDELRATASAPADRQAELEAADLVALERQGIAIGSHSESHPILEHCEPAAIESEMTNSFATLSAMLGAPPAAFAYPGGSYHASAREAVINAGYRIAFAFDHRLSAIPPPDRFAV